MPKKYILSIFSSIIFLLFSTVNIYAHPLVEVEGVKVYDQKQLLTVGVDATTLTIDITFYPIEKIKVWDDGQVEEIFLPNLQRNLIVLSVVLKVKAK